MFMLCCLVILVARTNKLLTTFFESLNLIAVTHYTLQQSNLITNIFYIQSTGASNIPTLYGWNKCYVMLLTLSFPSYNAKLVIMQSENKSGMEQINEDLVFCAASMCHCWNEDNGSPDMILCIQYITDIINSCVSIFSNRVNHRARSYFSVDCYTSKHV